MNTAMAIKDILAVLQKHKYHGDGALLTWAGEEELERALTDFAEAIKREVTEPD